MKSSKITKVTMVTNWHIHAGMVTMLRDSMQLKTLIILGVPCTMHCLLTNCDVAG